MEGFLLVIWGRQNKLKINSDILALCEVVADMETESCRKRTTPTCQHVSVEEELVGGSNCPPCTPLGNLNWGRHSFVLHMHNKLENYNVTTILQWILDTYIWSEVWWGLHPKWTTWKSAERLRTIWTGGVVGLGQHSQNPWERACKVCKGGEVSPNLTSAPWAKVIL